MGVGRGEERKREIEKRGGRKEEIREREEDKKQKQKQKTSARGRGPALQAGAGNSKREGRP
jgi:hypothetical protein